jgi:hypothetical protein
LRRRIPAPSLRISGYTTLARCGLHARQALDDEKIGMNSPGIDDKCIVLNFLHWLTEGASTHEIG